jgi:hypothetical protein
MSEHKIINYINENYSVEDLYEAVTGRKPGVGKVYCPFHKNTNTPAAKIYGNVLKCFGECNRVYGAYDFLKSFYPEEINKIKRTILLSEPPRKDKNKKDRVKREDINLNQPIEAVIKTILNGNS